MAANKAIYDTSMKRAHDYAWAGQWERAIKEYGRALAEFPDDRTVQRNMAQCLFRLRQWPQALAAYESLISSEPEDLFAINRLAEIYLALGQQERALATYTRLADLYTQSNQFHEAIRALRDFSKAVPKDKDVHHRLLELSHLVGDRSAQAAEHLALSRIYLEEGSLSEAQQHADAAASLDPENPDVKRSLYTVRRLIAEKSSTLPLHADNDATRGMPGTASLQGSEKGGESPEAADLVARATEAQNKGEFRVALDLYEKAMQAGSVRPSVFYNAGLLNQQMSHPELAVAYLERSLQDPEFAMSSNFALGQCYHAMHDYSKAAAAFERALRLINVQQLSRSDADELVEIYSATANAHLGDNNPGRAASLYTTLVTLFKERKWSHPQLPELERKADELYNRSIQSKLLGISRGSAALSPDAVPQRPEQATPSAEPVIGSGGLTDGATTSLPTKVGTGAMLSSSAGMNIVGAEPQQTPAVPHPAGAEVKPTLDTPPVAPNRTPSSLRTITEFLRTSQAPGAPEKAAEMR
ncbi:MAG: tetratricopeptide repeat protein, partial [Chloroflexota bacterium]|nr:tetratricopeptide repeat protein [Chloroflexota bacterium]